MTTKTISANFPFESKYVEIDGSKIHYIDEGSGEVALFLIGMPLLRLWHNLGEAILNLKGRMNLKDSPSQG